VELRRQRRNSPVGTVELEPAAAAEIRLGAGPGGERLMLGNRAAKQRPHQLRRLDQTRRPRSGAKGCQPGHDPRQVREMIVGPRRTFERNAEKLHPIRRKAGWKYGVALDDARIAVGGALARPGAVDQRDPEAALGEMNGDRGADNAGAEHDDIGTGHGTPAAVAGYRMRTRAAGYKGYLRNHGDAPRCRVKPGVLGEPRRSE